MRLVGFAGLVAAVVAMIPDVPVAGQAPPRAFKVAYYNIKSGVGQAGLPGSTVTFADGTNCTDPSRPLNAWGRDIVQAELRARIAGDPSVVLLGLSEAWVCATPAAVQEALGWPARTSERNGTAAISRYGFAGPQQWLQLDTSHSPNPRETRWVLRVPVCLDVFCSRSVVVFVSHSAPDAVRDVDKYTVAHLHTSQTLDFMAELPAGQPHVLLGDLNVFEGTSRYCGSQLPHNLPLQLYREAGYLDGWPVVHGAAEGFTGMWNRAGCGSPAGYLWKRIDYAWSKHMAPLTMERFGMVPAGTPAPSDHAGIIVEYPHPDALAASAPPSVALMTPAAGATVADTVSITVHATDDIGVRRVELIVNGRTVAVDTTAPYAFTWDTRQVSNGEYVLQAAATDTTGHRVRSPARTITVANGPLAGDEIVLHALEAADVRGSWALVTDGSAASHTRLQHTEILAPAVTRALGNPASYAEFTFSAEAGRPYRLWIRGRATADSADHDSVFVQFDRSVTAAGSSTFRIGTTSAAAVSLEDCHGCGLSGWGWQDTATGRDVLGPLVYFAQSGPQRLRIQAAEAGLGIDQIVLSATLYQWQAPGTLTGDATVLPSSVSGMWPPAPSGVWPPAPAVNPEPLPAPFQLHPLLRRPSWRPPQGSGVPSRWATPRAASPTWSALLAERVSAFPARRLTPSREAPYQPESTR